MSWPRSWPRRSRASFRVLARVVAQLAHVLGGQPRVAAIPPAAPRRAAVPGAAAVEAAVGEAAAAVVAARAAAALLAVLLTLALALALAITLALPLTLPLLALLATPLLAVLTLLALTLAAVLLAVAGLLLTVLLGVAILLTLVPLLRTLARALGQRLGPARQTARAIERLLLLVLGGVAALADRRLRFVETLAQLVDAAGNVSLGGIHVVLVATAADQLTRVAHLVAQAVVANRSRGLGHLAGCGLLVARGVARGAIQLPFQLAELLLEHVLLLVDLTALLRSLRGAGRRQLLRLLGDLLLPARDVVGLRLGLLDVALGALRLPALQAAFGLAQPLEGGLRLGGRVGVAASRGLAHRIRRLAHLPRRVGQVLPLLFTRQAFQPACGLFHLFGQRPLLRVAGPAATATTTAALLLSAFERAAPLPLGLLLLTARQLLQLLQQLVHLAVAFLLHRLVGRLVAAGHLVQFLVEDVGQLLLHARRRPRRHHRPAGRR